MRSCADAAFVGALRPGDLIFTSRRWWAFLPLDTYVISRAIQRHSGSPWNHVMIVTEIPRYARNCYAECASVVEAHYPQVVTRSLASAVDHTSDLLVTRHKQMTEEAAARGLRWLRRHRDDEYDVTLIAKMRDALRTRGVGGLRELQHKVNDRFWICSELAAAFISACGLDACPGFNPGESTSQVPDPGTLALAPQYTRVYPA